MVVVGLVTETVAVVVAEESVARAVRLFQN